MEEEIKKLIEKYKKMFVDLDEEINRNEAMNHFSNLHFCKGQRLIVKEILNDLNKEMAIIIVTHDVGTISSYVKTIACVNRKLHYHKSNIITEEQLAAYNCPIKLITHGDVPHTVLKQHSH